LILVVGCSSGLETRCAQQADLQLRLTSSSVDLSGPQPGAIKLAVMKEAPRSNGASEENRAFWQGAGARDRYVSARARTFDKADRAFSEPYADVVVAKAAARVREPVCQERDQECSRSARLRDAGVK